MKDRPGRPEALVPAPAAQIRAPLIAQLLTAVHRGQREILSASAPEAHRPDRHLLSQTILEFGDGTWIVLRASKYYKLGSFDSKWVAFRWQSSSFSAGVYLSLRFRKH